MGRRALVLVVALILAAVAGFVMYTYLTGLQRDVEKDQEKVQVFRASRAILEGELGDAILSQQAAVAGEENRQDLPEGFIVDEIDLTNSLRNRIAVGPIAKNGILTHEMFAAITADVRPLSKEIGPGMQAITIQTDAVRAINGFVRPGDRINVIVTVDLEIKELEFPGVDFGPSIGGTDTGTGEEQQAEDRQVTLTRFVLQGLNVLAVGQSIRPEEGEGTPVETPTTVAAGQTGTGQDEAAEQAPITIYTVEVTPLQAERLVFAFENGSTWLTLVPEDFVEVQTNGITINTLFEGNLIEDIFGS